VTLEPITKRGKVNTDSYHLLAKNKKGGGDISACCWGKKKEEQTSASLRPRRSSDASSKEGEFVAIGPDMVDLSGEGEEKVAFSPHSSLPKRGGKYKPGNSALIGAPKKTNG